MRTIELGQPTSSKQCETIPVSVRRSLSFVSLTLTRVRKHRALVKGISSSRIVIDPPKRAKFFIVVYKLVNPEVCILESNSHEAPLTVERSNQVYGRVLETTCLVFQPAKQVSDMRQYRTDDSASPSTLSFMYAVTLNSNGHSSIPALNL